MTPLTGRGHETELTLICYVDLYISMNLNTFLAYVSSSNMYGSLGSITLTALNQIIATTVHQSTDIRHSVCWRLGPTTCNQFSLLLLVRCLSLYHPITLPHQIIICRHAVTILFIASPIIMKYQTIIIIPRSANGHCTTNITKSECFLMIMV